MKPPALQLPPNEYSKTYFEQMLRVLTQYFQQNSAEVSYSLNRSVPSPVTESTQMGDDQHTFLVNTSGLTMTLPPASKERFGQDWTIILGEIGWVDITTSGADTLILPVADTVIRLNTRGSSVTLRCVSATSWGIV